MMYLQTVRIGVFRYGLSGNIVESLTTVLDSCEKLDRLFISFNLSIFSITG